eukprot:gene3092-6066_t
MNHQRVSAFRSIRTNFRMVSSSSEQPKTVFGYKTEDIRSLLTDVGNVIKNTGVRPGFARTVQATKAVTKLLQEYASTPTSFQTVDGKLSAPRILKKLFEELGATYVKLGQFIASSPTLFPKEYVLEFQSCLDNTPKVPYSEIRKIIQQDLKKPLTSIFSYIDPIPLASASIAQVHRGKLLDGTEIVIKVRKPGVEEVLKADLGFIYVASRLIEFINPTLSRISLSDIVGDLRLSMLNELDFKKEAANLDSFRTFLDSQGIIEATAPRPFHSASSTRVLTMEYLRGVPLADLEGIKQFSSNPEATLIVALRTWAASVAEHSFFHADVHAGNLLVLEDGRIGFIDFGIVGNLSPKVLNSIENAVQCFATQDYKGVAVALSRMGATGADVNVEAFGKDLQSVISRISTLTPEVVVRASVDGSTVSAQLSVDERETSQLVLDIVQVAEDNGLRLPREFGLLLKQSLYFDRYLKLLAPSLDPLTDMRIRSTDSEDVNGNITVGGKPRRGNGRVIDVDAITVK